MISYRVIYYYTKRLMRMLTQSYRILKLHKLKDFYYNTLTM